MGMKAVELMIRLALGASLGAGGVVPLLADNFDFDGDADWRWVVAALLGVILGAVHPWVAAGGAATFITLSSVCGVPAAAVVPYYLIACVAGWGLRAALWKQRSQEATI